MEWHRLGALLLLSRTSFFFRALAARFSIEHAAHRDTAVQEMHANNNMHTNTYPPPHTHTHTYTHTHTGVNMELLKQVGQAVTEFPADFTPHRQIKKVYEARRSMIDSGEGVDWGMAETLAYATLLSEGNHVRLSGQDVERGTFSHRCDACVIMCV